MHPVVCRGSCMGWEMLCVRRASQNTTDLLYQSVQSILVPEDHSIEDDMMSKPLLYRRSEFPKQRVCLVLRDEVLLMSVSSVVI